MRLLYSSLLILNSSFAFAQTWEAVGGGIQGGDSNICAPVFSLCGYNGKLYAAGLMTRAGNMPVNNIASWDGKRWDTLGRGLNGVVKAMCVYKNALCVGGQFSKAGRKKVNDVAQWVDTTRTIPEWYNLGAGISRNGLEGISAAANLRVLYKYDSNLYVGGAFSATGDGKPAFDIAKWNTTRWSKLPRFVKTIREDTAGGGLGYNGEINAFGVYKGKLYIGGGFNFWFDEEVPKDMHKAGEYSGVCTWDGKKWSDVMEFKFTTGRAINSMVMYDSILYIGGSFGSVSGNTYNNIVGWNGKNWVSLGAGIHGTVWAMQEYNGKLYVGGNFDSAGGVAAKNIAAWNGQTWEAVGAGLEGSYNGKLPQVSSLCVYKGELYAGGYFNSSGGKLVNHIAKLNLKGTKPVPTKSKK